MVGMHLLDLYHHFNQWILSNRSETTKKLLTHERINMKGFHIPQLLFFKLNIFTLLSAIKSFSDVGIE